MREDLHKNFMIDYKNQLKKMMFQLQIGIYIEKEMD